jgi:hypothetical protein
MMFADSHSDKTAGLEVTPVFAATTFQTYPTKVMVVMPWQKHISPITSYCVSQIMDRRRTASILNFGDAFIAHSRNSCADLFLQSPCDYMLTIDDDMVVPFGSAAWFNSFTKFNLPEPFASLNALDRLMSHNKSLVGALYFGRHPNGPPVYNEGVNPTEARYARGAPYNLVKPTKWVGTGCMLVHRSVFEDIEKRFPRLRRGQNNLGGQWFTSSEVSLVDQLDRVREALTGPLSGDKAYKALTLLEAASATARQENVLGCGEDVSFCLRAGAAGHQPYIDMGLVCGHIGHCVYGPKNTAPKPNEGRNTY